MPATGTCPGPRDANCAGANVCRQLFGQEHTGIAVLPLHEHKVGYSVCGDLLSQFGAKPTLPACKLMVYLLQYVRGTVAKGIRFIGSASDMDVFTNADWAGDIYTHAQIYKGMHCLCGRRTYSGGLSCRQRCRLLPGRVSTKPRMLTCRDWCGFGGFWASYRGLVQMNTCSNILYMLWGCYQDWDQVLNNWLCGRCGR